MSTKFHLVKAMVFPVVMYGCESWTVKKAEHQRIDAFELWFWRKLLRVPWTARRSNQSILKEISLSVHWKDWSWSSNSNTLATSCEELTHWKRLWCWEGWGQEAKGTTEDEMAGWHHWLNGRKFEQAPGDGEGQGSLALQSMGSQRFGHDWVTVQQENTRNNSNINKIDEWTVNYTWKRKVLKNKNVPIRNI